MYRLLGFGEEGKGVTCNGFWVRAGKEHVSHVTASRRDPCIVLLFSVFVLLCSVFALHCFALHCFAVSCIVLGRDKVPHVSASWVWERREKVSHVTVSWVWGRREKMSHVTASRV